MRWGDFTLISAAEHFFLQKQLLWYSATESNGTAPQLL